MSLFKKEITYNVKCVKLPKLKEGESLLFSIPNASEAELNAFIKKLKELEPIIVTNAAPKIILMKKR